MSDDTTPKNFCSIRYRDGKAPDGSPVWKACPGRVCESGQRCPLHGGPSTVHEPAIERIALLRADLEAAGALTPSMMDLLDTTEADAGQFQSAASVVDLMPRRERADLREVYFPRRPGPPQAFLRFSDGEVEALDGAFASGVRRGIVE